MFAYTSFIHWVSSASSLTVHVVFSTDWFTFYLWITLVVSSLLCPQLTLSICRWWWCDARVLSPTEGCWNCLTAEQSLPSPDRIGQDSWPQISLVMAARPAPASGGTAESKRTDLRANEKKCCECFGVFFSLCSINSEVWLIIPLGLCSLSTV